MNPILIDMVGREQDKDRLHEIAADRRAKMLLAQRPSPYRSVQIQLGQFVAAVGRRLQMLRPVSEIASE